MPTFFSPLAEADLEGIGDYIAADNPSRAVSFISEVRMHCERIERNPRAYRTRLELGKGIRSCAHGNYLILFTMVDAAVLIVRILHGARDLRRALEDEPPEDDAY
ncbi:MAG: type II toxin-antitoxin system RelE/ParE family toxin [Burkholderiaceae bacterium]|nr:type II toxin-antitoxin system RelE/ParE family toxin [Burkholderiaceae bacterium]